MHRRRRNQRTDRDARLRSLFGRLEGADEVDAGAMPFDTPDLDWDALPAALDPSAGDLQPSRALRKRQQLASMVAHVAPLIRESGRMRIVDCGAGSGHLGLTLAQLFPHCEVLLLERKEWTSTMSAQRICDMGLDNCSAHCGSVEDFIEVAGGEGESEGKPFVPDLCVSLHSCGLLTDKIVELCLQVGSSFVLCPCCYGQVATSTDHPKSAHLQRHFSNAEFSHIASAADFTVRAGNWEFENDRNFCVARRCMRLVDRDRCMRVAERGAYGVLQSSLTPLGCSPKNNIIIGVHPRHQHETVTAAYHSGLLKLRSPSYVPPVAASSASAPTLGTQPAVERPALPSFLKYEPETYQADLVIKVVETLMKIQHCFLEASLEAGERERGELGVPNARAQVGSKTDVAVCATTPCHHRLRVRFAIRRRGENGGPLCYAMATNGMEWMPITAFPLASRRICAAMDALLLALEFLRPSESPGKSTVRLALVESSEVSRGPRHGALKQGEPSHGHSGDNQGQRGGGEGGGEGASAAALCTPLCTSLPSYVQGATWEVSKELEGGLQAVEFLGTMGSDVLVTLVYDRPICEVRWRPAAEALRERLAKALGGPEGCINVIGRSKKVIIAVNSRSVVERLKLSDGRVLRYKQIQGSFSNPNGIVNGQCLEWLCRMADDIIVPGIRRRHGGQEVGQEGVEGVSGVDLLELYCGNGNHTVALGPKFRRVLTVELDRNLCAACRDNLHENGVHNVTVMECHSHRFCQRLLRAGRPTLAPVAPTPSPARSSKAAGPGGCTDCGETAHKDAPPAPIASCKLDSYNFGAVLVDPPRAGLDDTTLSLVGGYPFILYISCNPEALRANLDASLGRTHVITHAAVFDQFPYTRHIEVGVLLEARTEGMGPCGQ